MKDSKIPGPIADLIKLIAEITVKSYLKEQKETPKPRGKS